MRLLALLPAALFLTPFAAAQDSLRAEIRKIVREEIRAAMQELHGAPATKAVEGTKVAPGAKAHTVFGKMVDGKPVETAPIASEPIEVRIGDQNAKWEELPAHSFQWVTGEKSDAAGGKVLHIVEGKPIEISTKGTKGLKVQRVQGRPIEVEGHEIQKQIQTELGNIKVHFEAEGADEPAHKGNVFLFHPSAGNQQIKIVKAKADGAPAECQVECTVECKTDTKQTASSCCEAAKATAECCEGAKKASECCEGEKCEECVVEVKAEKAEKAAKKQKKEGGKKKSKKAKPVEEVEGFELKVG